MKNNRLTTSDAKKIEAAKGVNKKAALLMEILVRNISTTVMDFVTIVKTKKYVDSNSGVLLKDL